MSKGKHTLNLKMINFLFEMTLPVQAMADSIFVYRITTDVISLADNGQLYE